MSNQKDCNNCCSLFLRNLLHGFCVNSHSSESGRLGQRNQRAECAGADSHGRVDHVSERTSAREVPRRGGGREPCHSPKYFGQPYSSLPHRLRAEPPRRGGQGVSTPFSTVCGSPARGGFVSGFPHFNKPCLSCYFVGLHGVFHSFNMVFHISTVERCRKPVQNVEKARRSPPRRDFLRFVQSCFTRCSFFGSML